MVTNNFISFYKIYYVLTRNMTFLFIITCCNKLDLNSSPKLLSLNRNLQSNIGAKCNKYKSCSLCMENYVFENECFYNKNCLEITNNINTNSYNEFEKISQSQILSQYNFDNLLSIFEICFNDSQTKLKCNSNKEFYSPISIVFNKEDYDDYPFESVKVNSNDFIVCKWEILFNTIYNSSFNLEFVIFSLGYSYIKVNLYTTELNASISTIEIHNSELLKLKDTYKVEIIFYSEFTTSLNNYISFAINAFEDNNIDQKSQNSNSNNDSILKNFTNDQNQQNYNLLLNSNFTKPPFYYNNGQTSVKNSEEEQKPLDILIIIIPCISGFVCLIAVFGFICSCCSKKRTPSTITDIETINNLRRLANLLERTNLQNFRHDGDRYTSVEDPNTRNKRILNEMLQNELKGEIYSNKVGFNTECTICLDEYGKDSFVLYLECKHVFHRTCLKEWLEKNITVPKCPNCNYNILFKTYDQVSNDIVVPNLNNLNNRVLLRDNDIVNVNIESVSRDIESQNSFNEFRHEFIQLNENRINRIPIGNQENTSIVNFNNNSNNNSNIMLSRFPMIIENTTNENIIHLTRNNINNSRANLLQSVIRFNVNQIN